MVRQRHNSASSRAMLAAAFLAFGSDVILTPAHGQTVIDVFDVFKEVVKQSQNRPGKVRKRVDTQVKRLQEGLSSLGYYNGEADGIYGPNTDRALARFLKDRSLQKPQPGEANALGRMVQLVEAGLTEDAPNADSTQPDQAPQTDGDDNWIAAYAEARGGCSYFDQVLSLTKAPDGGRLTGNESDLFGKPVVDWAEADYALLEQSYFSACGARSGDMRMERDQFQSSILASLRSRVDQTKEAVAEAAELERQKREKATADAAATRLLQTKLPEIESAISACEQKLEPTCARVAEESLAVLSQLTEPARSVAEPTDYPMRVYGLESRALDIRAQSYEANKFQDTNAKLINNCGEEIAGRKLSDPIFDQPILWFQPNFTVRHYVCFFPGKDVISDLNQLGDGVLTFRVKDIRLEFEPMEILRDTGRYGGKKPVGEGGVLAPVRVQNGLESYTVENAEIGVRLMGELVQRYSTAQ